jgi:hypothetical protein
MDLYSVINLLDLLLELQKVNYHTFLTHYMVPHKPQFCVHTSQNACVGIPAPPPKPFGLENVSVRQFSF